MLGGGSVAELYGAIAVGDAGRFQAVPGVGKRTAERIIVELREKVGEVIGEGIIASRGGDGSPRAVARDGLLELGFALGEAEGLLAEVDGETAEELLSAALRATRQARG